MSKIRETLESWISITIIKASSTLIPKVEGLNKSVVVFSLQIHSHSRFVSENSSWILSNISREVCKTYLPRRSGQNSITTIYSTKIFLWNVQLKAFHEQLKLHSFVESNWCCLYAIRAIPPIAKVTYWIPNFNGDWYWGRRESK